MNVLQGSIGNKLNCIKVRISKHRFCIYFRTTKSLASEIISLLKIAIAHQIVKTGYNTILHLSKPKFCKNKVAFKFILQIVNKVLTLILHYGIIKTTKN